MDDVGASSTVRVARVLARTVSEGPGVRTAIWTQGCTIRCTGCFNPEFWQLDGGRDMSVTGLISAVSDAGSEGVTFLGGEPFDQSDALSRVAQGVRARGLTVMTFTGHTRSELQRMIDAGDHGAEALLNATDLLVDGPFDAGLVDSSRPWVGSTNQQFHAITPRYADIAAEPERSPDRIEVTVGVDGTAQVNGWATVEALDLLLNGLGDDPPALRVARKTGSRQNGTVS